MQTLKEEIRDSLIESAIAEFYQHGYEKASMRNIANAAGTSVSNTYNYFQNKHQLFEYIMEPVYTKVKNLVIEATDNTSIRHSDKQAIPSFANMLIRKLLEIDARERQLLAILVENSRGTRFENTKNEIAELIKVHLSKEIRSQQEHNDVQKDYILSLISANYIDGLFKILRDFQSPEWAALNMETLITYHLHGIKAL